jgi:hypothetical protein
VKKPINIRPEEDAIGKREKETRIGAVPAVILLLFLAAILSFLFFLRPQVPAAPDGKIEVFINRAMPLPPGTSSTISAFSSCGNFSLFLDGKEIASGGPSMDYTLVPTFTKHILEAKNSRCKASGKVQTSEQIRIAWVPPSRLIKNENGKLNSFGKYNSELLTNLSFVDNLDEWSSEVDIDPNLVEIT